MVKKLGHTSARLSKKHGKHRHVSANTVTKSRIRTGAKKGVRK